MKETKGRNHCLKWHSCCRSRLRCLHRYAAVLLRKAAVMACSQRVVAPCEGVPAQGSNANDLLASLDKLFFGGSLLEVQWKGSILALASSTCALAVILNISQYSVIRFLGAGTYTALSQLKTVVIITIGSLLFDRKVNARQLLAGTAIFGIYLLLSRDQCDFGQPDENSETSSKQESDSLIPAQEKTLTL